VSQWVWHVKEPSLLKAVSAKLRSKFAALSQLMVTVARCYATQNKQTKNICINDKICHLKVKVGNENL
jgi:hypothetical protein